MESQAAWLDALIGTTIVGVGRVRARVGGDLMELPDFVVKTSNGSFQLHASVYTKVLTALNAESGVRVEGDFDDAELSINPLDLPSLPFAVAQICYVGASFAGEEEIVGALLFDATHDCRLGAWVHLEDAEMATPASFLARMAELAPLVDAIQIANPSGAKRSAV